MNHMSIAIEQVMTALSTITKNLPIGTNLALLHFLWMLVGGAFLGSRGAIFPGLSSLGLAPDAVRRAWAAFRGGVWLVSELLESWQRYIADQGKWIVHQYEGYRPKAVDLTPFWRPTLKGCESQHYHPQAGKALPAIPMGLVALVGHVGEQRIAVLTDIVRANLKDPSEKALKANLLRRVARRLGPDEMPVLDAGFKIKELQEAKLERYVVRQAKNCTFRRNYLPPYKGRGRMPEYGPLVRPLARSRKGKSIPATPPDQTVTWTDELGLELKAEMWLDLIASASKPDPAAKTVDVTAIYDPRYTEPLLVACPVRLKPTSLRGLYRDRWPVEQPPLAAKQMVGAERQFVFAPESCQRLPELSLLAGSIQTYVAATLPAVPTGFWDRQPRRTPGRLRRVLMGQPFPDLYPLPERIREKASVTAHLPKGILGHRRVAQAI
jgi:hypothetical protein